MMLITAERKGLEKILSYLEDIDLFNLCHTITKRMIRTSNRPDAVDAILSCIQKPNDLLKRQKITRKVLFSYLLEEKGSVSPEGSKIDLMTMCLELWKSSDIAEEMDCKELVAEENHDNNFETMGVAFTKWFFPLLNNLENFGTEHFWADCKLEVHVTSEGFSKELTTSGDMEVVNFLSSLIINEKLFFHPNETGGTSCQQEAHGLVKVSVSGIVHKLNNCVGLFDALFGLVRNPAYENNWKIKWLCMYMRHSAAVDTTVHPIKS